MDAITDLSSKAISFITLIQDILKNYRKGWNAGAPEKAISIEDILKSETAKELYDERIFEILAPVNKKADDVGLRTVFQKIAGDLLSWMSTYGIADKLSDSNLIPHFWRKEIKKILYREKTSREALSEAIGYCPIQIILALGGGVYDVKEQKIFQVLNPDTVLLKSKDTETNRKWWASAYKDTTRKDEARRLFADLRHLSSSLEGEQTSDGNPLPFESIFQKELDEIEASREGRLEKLPAKVVNDDPLGRARGMNLKALAFSGGGIRSATFNLGVLQGLAKENRLQEFDYLSTVSGGGYIGSWLSAWIKRTGSINKVIYRLDPNESRDPFADEVRPLRWLRMFSNYLSPNSGIMSPDAWTVGMTWLRNTLINQVILLLALVCFLACIGHLYIGWTFIEASVVSTLIERVLPALLFISAAVLAGIGMRSYGHSGKSFSHLTEMQSDSLVRFLLILGVLAAYLGSGWLYSLAQYCYTAWQLTARFTFPAIFTAAAMLVVSFMGRYDLCISGRSAVKSWTVIIMSTVAASITGLILLILVADIIEYLRFGSGLDEEHSRAYTFILGVPLILELVSITIVIRMALLGRQFPDERREWWGRAGAHAHRIMLFWLIICGGALLIENGWTYITRDFVPQILTAIGGWGIIIGAAVKFAFSEKTSGDKQPPGKFKEALIGVAPYLFALGFLLIGALVLGSIRHNVLTADVLYGMFRLVHGPKFNGIVLDEEELSLFLHVFSVLLTVVLIGITLTLSTQVGVNEFSLHHFYKNRLVRAYLGATRRRTDRDKTANPFTGFDSHDDMKLSELKTSDDYIGPYVLINTALNGTIASDLDRQDRKAEAFVFSPLYCGFDCSRTRSAASSETKTFDYGYRPTARYAYDKGPGIGTAMAISGAAVNPNMGYHSAPATAFLLTIFNVRLGWWLGNTRRKTWKKSDPPLGLLQLINDLTGKSNTASKFISLSDGGHFDNMGIYELIRRRVNYILLCDAEEDAAFTCEGLANAIRRCRIDFGVEINIDVSDITDRDKDGFSKRHAVKGTILYPEDEPGEPSGTLVYIKSSLCGNEPVDIREYHLGNPVFPHQSTGDQFFDESQFESYRKLGYHIMD